MIFGRIIIALFGIVSVRIVTELISPENYAIVAIIITSIAVSNYVVVGPFGQYLHRNAHNWIEKKLLIQKLRYFNKLFIVAASLSTGIVYVNYPNNEVTLEVILICSFVVVCGAVYQNFFNLIVSLLNILEFTRTFVLLNITANFFGILLSAALVYTFESALLWPLGQFTSQCICSLVGYRKLKYLYAGEKTAKAEKHFMSLKDFKMFCVPLMLSSFFSWYFVSGYRLNLENNLDVTTFALLVIAFNASVAFFALIETISIQLLNPPVFRKYNSSQSLEVLGEMCSTLISISVVVYLNFAIYLFLMRELIFGVVVSTEYSGASVYFGVGIFFEMLNACIRLYNLPLNLLKKPVVLIPLNIIYFSLLYAFLNNLNNEVELIYYYMAFLSPILVAIAATYIVFYFYLGIKIKFKRIDIMFMCAGVVALIFGNSGSVSMVSGNTIFAIWTAIFAAGFVVYVVINRQILYRFLR